MIKHPFPFLIKLNVSSVVAYFAMTSNACNTI